MKFVFILGLLLIHQHRPDHKTIRIAGMEWMAKDLDVVTFRNGDTIPFVFTEKTWESAGNNKKPVWTYYAVNGISGKLYNGYAVIDPRGLAPEGWHIATEKEWYQLTDAFNAKHSATGLRSRNLWQKSCNGNDSTGFSALPTGWVRYDGVQRYQGETGFWYTQTEGYDKSLVAFDIRCHPDIAANGIYDKSFGFAVRCVKDQ